MGISKVAIFYKQVLLHRRYIYLPIEYCKKI